MSLRTTYQHQKALVGRFWVFGQFFSINTQTFALQLEEKDSPSGFKGHDNLRYMYEPD